jgi:hypothetical protein
MEKFKRFNDNELRLLLLLTDGKGYASHEIEKELDIDPGNLSKIVKKLEGWGWIYRTKRTMYSKGSRSRKEEYPFYIEKSIINMDEMQHALADPAEGKIWQYNRIRLAQKEKTKCNEPSDVYLRAVEFLTSSVHLYIWCRMIHSDLRMAGREAYEEEKSAEHRPKHIFYRLHADELAHLSRMLPHMHNRCDLEKLVYEIEEIRTEKDCRAMGIVLPTAEELAHAFRSPAPGHIETYISPAR